ncbi:MAG: 3-phosphoserine/phosphohydroxythreonine transaminase [Saprospiraceae bacterium]
MKKHNFNAGPAILPKTVIKEAAKNVLELQGSGLSVLEISHRSKVFESILAETKSLVKELLHIGDDYEVLFLTGGASSQFFMVPMNFLGENETACYFDTGTWANKAIKEAKLFGNVEVTASSKESNYSFIPKNAKIPKDAKYLHITSNNTIFGTEYFKWPKTDLPVICDMSSDIFSRPIPADKFDFIYAGAQKNIGPAGMTLVVAKKTFLENAKVQGRKLPAMLDYQTHVKEGSMYNTPPVFSIYVSMLTMRWMKAQGGLEAMERRAKRRANLLYKEIDENQMFKGTVEKGDRSRMNVCFLATTTEAENMLMELCKSNGIEGLKGHRSVGGFRASMYNAMETSSVQLLVNLMKEVAAKLA